MTQNGCSPCHAIKKAIEKRENLLVDAGVQLTVKNISNDPLALKWAQDNNVLSTPALEYEGVWFRSVTAIQQWLRGFDA